MEALGKETGPVSAKGLAQVGDFQEMRGPLVTEKNLETDQDQAEEAQAQEVLEAVPGRGRAVPAEEMEEEASPAPELKIRDPITRRKPEKKDTREKCCCGWRYCQTAAWVSLS